MKNRLRLFVDSNVLTGGIVAKWGLDRAVLSLCAARICKLVLAQAVREEVEKNLLLYAARLEPQEASEFLDEYVQLIKLCRPEIIPLPTSEAIRANRQIIRHAADVPVLLSAMASKPDWLLTHNTKHFSAEVAKRTKLKIAPPADFFAFYFR